MLDVGVDVDMDILHIAPLARFLRSSHNFKPKPEGPYLVLYNSSAGPMYHVATVAIPSLRDTSRPVKLTSLQPNPKGLCILTPTIIKVAP